MSLGRGIAERELPALRTTSIRRLRLRDERSFYVRGNGWDAYTFFEIFFRGVYDSGLPLPSGTTVVDLGSNIGATCAYWRTCEPAASIVAVEPERSNSAMLRLNLGEEAVVEDAALSNASGWALFDVGERSTGHHLAGSAPQEHPASGTRTRTLTLDDILRVHRPARVGLMKVDIEGAEETVFTRAWDLLGVTDKIVMEIHDDAVRPRIVAALAEQGFEHHRPRGPRDMADLFVRIEGRMRTR